MMYYNYKCPRKCGFESHSQRGINIHESRFHGENRNIGVPNLIGMGVMKRKLTRKEAKRISQEVLSMDLKNPNTNFMMAILKAIEVAQ